jgi:hypothetical protein
MENENFWNDELVKEFVGKCLKHDFNGDIDAFKKSKSVVNNEWEIVSFVGKNGEILRGGVGVWYYGLTHSEWLDKCVKNHPIHSVRRISDDSIWSVGDKIVGFGDSPTIVIDKFEIDYFDNSKISAYSKNGYGKGYQVWGKAKQPLFTTNDNKAIYSWHEVVWFVNGSWYLGSEQASAYDVEKLSHFTYFSTKELAEEYILMNKPCLSLNDVVEHSLYGTDKVLGRWKNNPHFLKLKELVKSKL